VFSVIFIGCNSILSGIFKSDHLFESEYNFVMFDDDSNMICSGIFNISKINDSKIKGKFKILDSYEESIGNISGFLEGTENPDRSRADIVFLKFHNNDDVTINFNSTWNLLKGTWSSTNVTGRIVAFEKKNTF
jgi:hypothetical protein